MPMAYLILDRQIRLWVFLPIVAVTFLVGVIRHYVSIYLSSNKRRDLHQIQENQLLFRLKALRENGRYLSRQSFEMRRQAFNRKDDPPAQATNNKKSEREQKSLDHMMDPSVMSEMLKGNLTNVLPMIAIGGLINWLFSGFITTKVPFPLTLPFKSMLQRGIELSSLDASWVSSASWYFLNAFGLRNLYTLVLGEDNAADENKNMEKHMREISSSKETCILFKSEWENLHIMAHQWELVGIEQEIGVYSSA